MRHSTSTIETPGGTLSGKVPQGEHNEYEADQMSVVDDIIDLSTIEANDGHGDHHFRDRIKSRFHLEHMHATRPGRHFNPTNVRMHIHVKASPSYDDLPTAQLAPHRHHSDVHVIWRSRDNRKGRGSLAVDQTPPSGNEHTRIHAATQTAT